MKASDRAIRTERQRDAAVMLAAGLVAIIRVNVMRGTWAEATPEQVDEFLAPWIAKLRVAQGHPAENTPDHPPRIEALRLCKPKTKIETRNRPTTLRVGVG